MFYTAAYHRRDSEEIEIELSSKNFISWLTKTYASMSCPMTVNYKTTALTRCR